MRATVTSTPYDNDRRARDDNSAAGKEYGHFVRKIYEFVLKTMRNMRL